MKRTNADNQDVKLKNKIKEFFLRSIPFLEQGFCPTKDLLSLTLDKWSLFCLYNLSYQDVMRFNELKNRISGISSRMLSVTLKKLEDQGMVERIAYAEVPPKVEYKITPFGAAYADKLIDLSNWFIDNNPKTVAASKCN